MKGIDKIRVLVGISADAKTFDIIHQSQKQAKETFGQEIENEFIKLRISTKRFFEKNPMIWMLLINDFLVDIRIMPREVQVAAFNQGLIPYIPANRDEK